MAVERRRQSGRRAAGGVDSDHDDRVGREAHPARAVPLASDLTTRDRSNGHGPDRERPRPGGDLRDDGAVADDLDRAASAGAAPASVTVGPSAAAAPGARATAGTARPRPSRACPRCSSASTAVTAYSYMPIRTRVADTSCPGCGSRREPLAVAVDAVADDVGLRGSRSTRARPRRRPTPDEVRRRLRRGRVAVDDRDLGGVRVASLDRSGRGRTRPHGGSSRLGRA